MSELNVRGLTRDFGRLRALDGVSFDVADGEFFCLFGPSSSGKTTTLRAIAGLETLIAGSVRFDGQDVTTAPVQGRGMSMIFQTFALYPHLSIEANLGYPLVRSGVARKEIRARVGEVAELLRVTHTLARKPSTLSGGEQQRVAIGRAIVVRPRLLLLDEPLTNLDAKLRHDMRAEFKRLHRELGMTMLYATPDQLEALTMGERIAMLIDGRIVETGTPHSLYGTPRHTRVASMIGSPAMNLIPGRSGRADGGGRATSLATPLGDFRLERGVPPDSDVTLGIRPHDIRPPGATAAGGPDASSDEGPDDGPRLAGRVHLTEPLGDVTILDVDVGGRVVKSVLSEELAARYAPGQPIELSFRMADAHCFMTDTGTRID